MKEADLTIFEYRKEKCEKNTDLIIHERLYGKFEKGTVRTETAGYVDFSIYRPETYRGNEDLPIIFNFHGGGFVLGFYEQDGRYCQRLADQTGCAVINVDYVLAPEFKFPKPIHSSYEAICGILERAAEYHLDSKRVFVCGHSAGGTIAADMCLIDRETKKIGIRGQIIDYAPLRQTVSEEDRKVIDSSKAIKMSRILQYIQWYFEDLKDMDDELASPLYADLHDLPDMLVISAEFDSLSGEEEAFADKARDAGVDVTYKKFAGCQHGFTHDNLKEYMPEQADQAWSLMAGFVRERL